MWNWTRAGLIVGALSVGSVVGACNSGESGTTTEPPATTPLAISGGNRTLVLPASVRSDGHTMSVAEARLEQPGYVVVYRDAGNGVPGRRLGSSPLLEPGELKDVTVPFDDELDEDTNVFVMVQREASDNSVLDWPGKDEPVAENGSVVTAGTRLLVG